MKKVLRYIIVILLLLLLGIPAKLFFIGEPVDGALLCCTVTQEGQELHLGIGTPASAIALRDWKYRQDGSTLYISARKVLVSPLFRSGTHQTTIDTSLLTEIYLGGNLIWAK